MTIYLYGFVPETSPHPPAELLGIEDSPVETVEFEGFTACVSNVSPETYSQPGLSAQLEDLAWVGRRGLEHERVVTWCVDQAGIVPARLFTLYSSRDALVEEVADRSELIGDLLARFRDLLEWHLKVSYDPEAMAPHLGAESEEVRELDEAISASAPGRAYLLQRKRAAVAGEQAHGIARHLAEALLGRIAPLVRETMILPVPERAADSRVALNAALLADREAGNSLRAQVEERAEGLGRRGVEVAFSGPWAPYRFMPEEDGEHAEAKGEAPR